jgi:hypothetical protein
MKKRLPSLFCTTAALLCLITNPATAGFVVPNVSPLENALPSAPGTLSGVGLNDLQPSGLVVTTTLDGGPGSLRNAIEIANPGDTITFQLTWPASIFLTNKLNIAKDLNIQGPGPEKLAITRSDGTNTPSFRILTVLTGAVSVTGVTIKNGRALNVTGFTDNLGGGIYNGGFLTISNCVIVANAAPTENGGNGFGGGIFTAEGSRIAIYNSTIAGNQASYAGGGLCTFHGDSVIVQGCTINGNTAGLQGGGVNFQGRNGTILNCTISGNVTPPDAVGSALIDLCFDSESSFLTVVASTITRNLGSTNGAYHVAALPDNFGLTNRVLSTIIADNDSPNFAFFGNPVFQSLGHNLDSDGSSGWVNGANGDVVGTSGSPINARLGALLDNGGLTLTHALLPGSPALNNGSCANANGAPLAIDQRGYPRPQTTGCDIGAFENQAPLVVCPHAQTNEVCGSSTLKNVSATVGDPDGDALLVVWTINGVATQTNFVNESHPPRSFAVSLNATLPLGTYAIGLSVSDGKGPVTSCSTTIVLRDTTPPQILSIKTKPPVLAPPNGQLVPVTVSVDATDCSGPVTSKIISVTSDQAISTPADYIITGNLTVLLRAASSSPHTRRVYTLNIESSDSSGNKSYGSTTIKVPGAVSGHDSLTDFGNAAASPVAIPGAKLLDSTAE